MGNAAAAGAEAVPEPRELIPAGDGDDLDAIWRGGGVSGGGTEVFEGFFLNGVGARNLGRDLAGMVYEAGGIDEGVDAVELGFDCGIALGRGRGG